MYHCFWSLTSLFFLSYIIHLGKHSFDRHKKKDIENNMKIIELFENCNIALVTLAVFLFLVFLSVSRARIPFIAEKWLNKIVHVLRFNQHYLCHFTCEPLTFALHIFLFNWKHHYLSVWYGLLFSFLKIDCLKKLYLVRKKKWGLKKFSLKKCSFNTGCPPSYQQDDIYFYCTMIYDDICI